VNPCYPAGEAIPRDGFVDEMRRFVAATDERLVAMERETSQLPHLRGMVLEQKIRMNPGYYLRPFGRRLQAVQVEDLLDELGIVDLSEDEELTLSRTDPLIRGFRRVGAPVVLVVEATWRPHTADVERQVARRRILADRGVDAVAVIASVQPAGDVVRSRAEAAGVALVEDLPEAA